jgi:glycosyltransferase involved in cell wall biosynthesis
MNHDLMHILLIHQAFAALDEPGGTRHHELARYLAANGHRITIIASPVSYLTGIARSERIPWVEKEHDGERITILRAYTYPALHRSFVHRVFSFFSFMISSFIIGLSIRDVDLLWGTSPPIFQGVTAWALSRLKRIPLLFEVRDLWPAFAIAVGVLKNTILIRASEWLEGFLYRHADLVMVNSPGYIKHVEDRGARRIEMVPNGADISIFNPQDGGNAFKRAHGFEDKYIALYAGAHGMSNDLSVLIDAADHLRDRKDITIVLLGDGKDKPILQSRAAELKVTNVYFLPPVPKNEMSSVLAGADSCIAILKPVEMYKTVYPNKVFDYMAAGRAIILAIDGVIRNVVEDAHAGTFVQPGDSQKMAEAILYLANNRDIGYQMGLSGREYIEKHFNRIDLANDMESLMLNLVSKSRIKE